MINGIIVIYKEAGFTSFDVVAKLRGMTHQKKVGHTGTLDPEAEGVLPICFGSATKVCDMLTDAVKQYRAELQLGVVTDTEDMTGKVLAQSQVKATEEEIKNAILSFVGEYDQVPPMYSALKVNGKKLYELAREGIEIERKARKVYIYNIDVHSVDLANARATFTVTCSKGTYIRSLCRDIGEKLGCGGAMSRLLRTKAGPFLLEDALKLSEVAEIIDNQRLDDIVLTPEKMFSEYSKMRVKTEARAHLLNGNKLYPDEITIIEECGKNTEYSDRFCVFDDEGTFKAVYLRDDGFYRPWKMFL